MTPEEIMAEALRKHVIGDGESIPVIGNTAESFMDEADAVTAALSAAGYSIHKDDPSMVYVPREPTEEISAWADYSPAAGHGTLTIREINLVKHAFLSGYRAMLAAGGHDDD